MTLELEMAQIQLHSGLDLLHTVHEAMAERPDNQTDYADAVYGVYDYLRTVEGLLAELAKGQVEKWI